MVLFMYWWWEDNFDCDIHSVVRQWVLKTAEKFSKNPEHFLTTVTSVVDEVLSVLRVKRPDFAMDLFPIV